MQYLVFHLCCMKPSCKFKDCLLQGCFVFHTGQSVTQSSRSAVHLLWPSGTVSIITFSLSIISEKEFLAAPVFKCPQSPDFGLLTTFCCSVMELIIAAWKLSRKPTECFKAVNFFLFTNWQIMPVFGFS